MKSIQCWLHKEFPTSLHWLRLTTWMNRSYETRNLQERNKSSSKAHNYSASFRLGLRRICTFPSVFPQYEGAYSSFPWHASWYIFFFFFVNFYLSSWWINSSSPGARHGQHSSSWHKCRKYNDNWKRTKTFGWLGLVEVLMRVELRVHLNVR